MEPEQLKQVLDQLSKIEQELKKNSKDGWDKINVVSSILVPVLVVFIGGMIAFRQNRETLDLDQTQFAFSYTNDTSMRLIAEAESVEKYLPHLISTNEYERILSLDLLRSYYPSIGEHLLRFSANYGPEKGTQSSRSTALRIINSRTNKAVQADVSLIGHWQLVRGDSDMDTDGNDKVRVQIASRLVKTPQEVVIEVNYRIQEFGGDHTTFSGVRKQSLFTAPKGTAIASITATNGLSASFSTTSVGRHHEFVKLRSDKTHWSDLRYRVDSEGNDAQEVGVQGKVAFEVVLEDLP